MEKMASANRIRANKHTKNKKNHPLKVVYITNPIKFKTSASEFRALVQELTGRDAVFAVEDCVGGGGGGAVNVAAHEDSIHTVEEVTEIGDPTTINGDEVVQQGSDPVVVGSYDDDDVFVSQEMSYWARQTYLM